MEDPCVKLGDQHDENISYPTMWDEDVVANLQSACDTILPGSSQFGIHHNVADLFNTAMPGFPVLVSALLDGFAMEEAPGVTFRDLDPAAKDRVIEKMSVDSSNDVKDVIDGLFLFTLGQNYNETHPKSQQVWSRIGYHGPSEGIRDA